jgi:diguanylate cyclase (GGDEF)-like protein/PAS domain S-box-containing protein
MIKSILLIEDNCGDARLFREMLEDAGQSSTEVTCVETMGEAETLLGVDVFDMILLDVGLPDTQGLDAVQRVRIAAPRVPLMVLTGLEDETLAIAALQIGAKDYLIKGQIDTRSLMRAMRYAVERNAMEEAIFAEKEHAQVTLNSIGDAVICTDVRGNVTFINVVAQKLTGWSHHEAVGRPATEICRILDATSREPMLSFMAMAASDKILPAPPSNGILISRDAKEIPVDDTSSAIHGRDGKISGAVTVFRDVSLARSAARQMAHSAAHDFLTDLPNRALVNDRITQAIVTARRRGSYLAVLFIDLDSFKSINDTLGHMIGDKLLQSVALRLRACVRESDTVSRQGGDEFVVLLSEIEQPEDAAMTARRMLKAMAEPHTLDHQDLHVTLSIGVSVYPGDGLNAEALIKNADTAMYQAKENGRAGYQFFKPAMNMRAVERQSLEENLRTALTRGELALHYQPIVDLHSGTIKGAEALLRWTHPVRGSIAPTQFMPVAEESGLILPIGSWMMREACRQAVAWSAVGRSDSMIAVNVSAMEFQAEHFLPNLFSILDDTGLDPQRLELELTEGTLMQRAESTIGILHRLRDKGVRVAVDDFGTGYSSFNYLRKFPLNALKIDKSFIRQISAAGEETSIVPAVISMARSLKLRVVAEGVETGAELSFLRSHQCDDAQGFYFSHPVPAERLTPLLCGVCLPA